MLRFIKPFYYRLTASLLLTIAALAVGIGIVAGSGSMTSPGKWASRTLNPTPKDIRRAQARVKVAPVDGDILVDLKALNIEALPAPMEIVNGADSSSIGTNRAYMSVTTPIVPPSSSLPPFGVLGSGFTPGETVQIFANGTLASSGAASADGTIAFSFNTGATPGFLTFRYVGLTSGKQAGGITQVTSTGPFLPGLAGAPHAVATGTAAGKFYLYGFGYPPTSSVPVFRDGILVTNATTNANGRYFIVVTPANNGNVSAVYLSDLGTQGSFAGVTLEERSDAGVLPNADQNVARAYADHAVDSDTGGSVTITAEGFVPGETVTVSVCDAFAVTADANGGVGGNFIVDPIDDLYTCTLTGTSGRVARVSFGATPDATNIRGMAVSPSFTTSGGTVRVFVNNVTPSSTGTVFVDGVSTLTGVPTDASGSADFLLTKPAATGFVHAVTWVSANGDTISAPLSISALTAAGVTVGGRVTASDGRGLTNAVVRITGPDGVSRIAITGRSGSFQFSDVESGRTYVVSVGSRRFNFIPRAVEVADNITDLIFTPADAFRGR